MEYRRFGNTLALRLDKSEEILTAVKAVAEKEKITVGYIAGIGATDNFTVGVFDTTKKIYNKFSYEGDYEITNLTGNLTTMNGEAYIHIHMTCAGGDGQIVGGHLLSGYISLTGELFISIADGIIERKPDKELGINRWVL